VIEFEQRIPSPWNPSGAYAYISSMSTEPAWRRRGCARAILDELLHEARSRGFGRIELHATVEGAALYRSAGFRGRDGGEEMRLELAPSRRSPTRGLQRPPLQTCHRGDGRGRCGPSGGGRDCGVALVGSGRKAAERVWRARRVLRRAADRSCRTALWARVDRSAGPRLASWMVGDSCGPHRPVVDPSPASDGTVDGLGCRRFRSIHR
jgi:Acetyltransferase (GNAT) family